MSISSKISTPDRVQYFYIGYGQKEAAGPRDPQFWLKGFRWLGSFLKGKPVGHPGAGHLPEHLRPRGPMTWNNKIFDYAFPGTVGATVAVKEKNKMDEREQFRYAHAVGRYESEREQAIAEGKAKAALQGATYVLPAKWSRGQGREPSPPASSYNWIASTFSGFGAMTAARRKYWRNLVKGKPGKGSPNILSQLGGTVFPVAAWQSPHFQSMFSPTKDWIKQRVEDTTEGLQGLQAGAELGAQHLEGWTPDMKVFAEEMLGTKARKEYNMRVNKYEAQRAEYEASPEGIDEMAQYEEEMKTWNEEDAKNKNDPTKWPNIPVDAEGNKRRPPQPKRPGPVDPDLKEPVSLMQDLRAMVSNTSELIKQVSGDVVKAGTGMAGSAENIDGFTAHLWNILDHAEKAVEDGLAYVKDNKRTVIAAGAAYMLAAGGIAGVIYWLKEVNKRRTLEEQDKRLARQQKKMMKMVLEVNKEDRP